MSSKSTKSQVYRHTLRSSALAYGTFCTDRVYIYPVPPERALKIVGLFVHFRMLFDSAITSDLQVLKSVGVTNERPLYYRDDPSVEKLLDINVAADANRRVDVKLDLTPLLNEDNVAFTPLFGADYETGDQTFIVFKLDRVLRDVLTNGTIELCKVDALYMTQEIR